MKFKILILGVILSFFVTKSLLAQLVTENTLTVEQLVNDVLLGEGVTAENIFYNGIPGNLVTVQAGTFNSENSNIPITEGVIMASGNITNAIGPNDSGSSSDNIGFESFDGEPDLEAAVGLSTFNAAVIEFDFTANADSLKFNYVFGSEEYNEFVCGTVNDVFGFFLAGPGITGTFSSPPGFPDGSINIALVPDTEVPVSINTVNIGVPGGSGGDGANCDALDPNWPDNSIYYIDNEGNADPNSTQLDGFTVVLTALADIECGETYHIKLAIADAGDSAWDSAVFLEAGSFSAFGEVFVDVAPTIGGAAITNPDFEDVLVAGCSEAFIELIRPTGLSVSEVTVVFGGTAIEGTGPGGDYILTGDELIFTFPEGVDTLGFTIETIYDGIPNEGEILEISIVYFDDCGEEVTASATIEIVDPYLISSETEDVVITCPADSTIVTAQGLDGIEPYTYEWINEGPGQSIWVDIPPVEQYYYVNISDACTESFGFDPIIDSVLVVNNIPPPLQVGIEPFFQPECPNEPIALNATVQDGNPDYTYTWVDSRGFPYPGQPDILVQNVNPFIESYIPEVDVFVTIEDICGTVVVDSTSIAYPIFDSLSVFFGPLTDNCPEEPVELAAITDGGAGGFAYNWSITEGDASFASGFGPETQITFVEPAGGFNTFEINVADKCRQAGNDMQIGTNEDGEPLFSGGASFDIRIPIIELDNLPNVLTPNGDNQNDFFVVEGIEVFNDARLEIHDRWGRLIYETDNYMAGSPDNRPVDAFDAQDNDDGTYFYIINIDSGECIATGSLQVLGSND